MSAFWANNKMGSVKSIEMDEVHLIWVFTSAQNSWLLRHISHRYFMKMLIENLEKRNLEMNGFSLYIIAKKLNASPVTDLFASRLNTHLPEFISYQTDPESKAVHVPAQSWTDLKFFYFLPFICLPRVIQKIWQDGAEGILVVPDWQNQLQACQLMVHPHTCQYLFRHAIITCAKVYMTC